MFEPRFVELTIPTSINHHPSFDGDGFIKAGKQVSRYF
jgi:hypothetical protein